MTISIFDAAFVPGFLPCLRRLVRQALVTTTSVCGALALAPLSVGAQPQSASMTAASAASSASSASGAAAGVAASPASAAEGPTLPERRWVTPFPRVVGHLTNKDLGLVINENDPYSVEVGEYYARARGIPAAQVLRVRLALKPQLSPQEFAQFSQQVDSFYGDKVQGLALAWKQPFAVNCNAITGALALGYDPKVCQEACQKPGHKTRTSTYFGSISTRPYKDHHMRLAMLLAARDAGAAKALIDRGVRSDGTLGRRGAPPVDVHFVTTSDTVRSVRQLFYPPAGPQPKIGVNVLLDQTDALRNADRVLLYMTGLTKVEGLESVQFVPGALADHLTSFGGKLDDPYGQMTVLSWIDAGATATYGTTSEPCAYPQKFPHPQVLLLFYVQGATALEAYWKSVAWPQQGLFVGEPLAAPYAH